EAAPQLEFSGRLFLDLCGHYRLVRRRTLNIGHLDFLEEAEVLDTLLRALHLGGVEGVALNQLELAADHLVEGPHVPHDVDPLDVHLRPLLNVEGYVNGAVVTVARDVRLDLDEGITPVAERI